MSYSLKIGHLFPDILNMYGDKGNIASLKSRLMWRGFEASVVEMSDADNMDFKSCDIVFLGGGSEGEDVSVCGMLREKKNELKEYIESGGVMLAFCGGFPMLGNYFKTKDEKTEGLGILDIDTEYGERFIGNVIINTEITGKSLTVIGFENHGQRTDIKGYTPFGNVITGNGNNGKDKTCGIVYKNLIATYLHGPLLPKNPALCDYILKKAIERKYGKTPDLAPLCDTLEKEAHEYCLKRFSM